MCNIDYRDPNDTAYEQGPASTPVPAEGSAHLAKALEEMSGKARVAAWPDDSHYNNPPAC